MGTSIQSQLISMQNSTSKLEAEKSKDRLGSDKLDKHAFLRLLTEQLRHQDPLKPMDNMQFLQQQAMFTQVEELQNLSKTISEGNSIAQASSLIGKKVTLVDPENYENSHTGIVQAAHFAEGNTAIQVDGALYPLSFVGSIENPATE
jgi:flagellar basal-body rod modification protein FlgD